MKKAVMGVITSLAAGILLTGCLVAPVQPPMGMVYTDYKAPLDWDQEGNSVGSKTGTAETMSILGLVALGDGSVKTAARNGDISTVHSADYEYFNVLGIYQRYRTVLHGE